MTFWTQQLAVDTLSLSRRQLMLISLRRFCLRPEEGAGREDSPHSVKNRGLASIFTTEMTQL